MRVWLLFFLFSDRMMLAPGMHTFSDKHACLNYGLATLPKEQDFICEPALQLELDFTRMKRPQ